MTPAETCVGVTGATGFIGRRLCAWLVHAGYRVRALMRGRPTAIRGIQWVAGELGERRSLAELADGCAAVVHCAGAVRGATAADFHGPNVDGVANLLYALTTASPGARLLHVSTLAARHPGLSHYAASKRAGEELALGAGLNATVLRPPAVYGPGDRELLPLLRGLHRGLGVVPGHTGRFALIAVDDLVAAIGAWLVRPDADGECYEVHDGAARGGYSWDEVLRAMETVRGGRVVAIRVPEAVLAAVAGASLAYHRVIGRAPMLTPGKVRELYFPDWTCSNERFSARTGWLPRIDLIGGLRDTLANAA
jgi:nucleoside-diphosphate-sugar epimerase